jgi:putative peptide zinc metalloprotease protein
MTDYKEIEFWLRPDLEVHRETAKGGEAVLVSGGRRHFRIQGLSKDILLIFDGEKHDVRWVTEKLALEANEDSWQRVFDALMRLHKHGLLWDMDVSGEPDAAPVRKSGIDFVWRHPVLPAALVQRLAQPFSGLLRPDLMKFTIPLMALAQIWFLWTHRALLHPQYYAAKFTAGSFATLVALNYLSLFLHELGHAAGCVAAGRRSGAIGVCLYIVFPGLYTDVTESWKMPKWQRLVVDAGGVYFSLIVATLATAGYLGLHSGVGGVLACLCDLTVLVNLNPILRMDGYWILGDFLDMPHLMDLNKAVTRSLLSRWLFARPVTLPAVPRTSRWSVQIYYCYYGFFVGLVGYFAFLSITQGVPYVFHNYPLLVQGACQQLALAPLSWSAARNILRLLLATASALGLLVVYFRMSRVLIRQIEMAWSTYSGAELAMAGKEDRV